jgi:FemAB-related protein (PEP-CTERM system-associated)
LLVTAAAPAGVPALTGRTPLVEVASATDGAAWDAFVAAHPDGTVDHLWGWQTIFRDVFAHRPEYLVASSGGTIVGLLPLVVFQSRLFGRQVVSLPMLNYGGLLVDHPSAIDPLVAAAEVVGRGAGACHVELRHRERITSLPGRQHKVSMRLSLPQSADALWQATDRKVRNQVRKAQKSSLDVTTGGLERVDSFYRVFAENMRDLGTPVYSKRLFTSVLQVFGDRTDVFVVSRGATPVAAALTLRFNDTVLVPWASSLRSYRHFCPNMLLYWSMLEHAIGGGARVFDFGRSTPEGGTYHFKLQWGAIPVDQSWEYILLRDGGIPDQGPSNGRFGTAIKLWQRLPLWLANAAGPRLVRHIP